MSSSLPITYLNVLNWKVYHVFTISLQFVPEYPIDPISRSQFVNMNAPERRALKVPDISSRHLDICVLYKTIDKEIITISNVHVSILRLVYIVGL